MPIRPGTRLGPYEIADLLGAGGMGEVWRARDTRLGREVAIKVLPEAFADDAERAVRFQREAQLLAAFNHPNIAAIHSFESVDGIRLLVMELVPGETVKQLLEKGPLPVARALTIARDVADALDAAHAKGILHRDLKPANVKVTPDGKVKLLDFGLAKAFAGGVAARDISESPTLGTDTTKQGMVLGTASYMSPEQTRGRTLDRRSDVWSFGCLLYEMLTGKKAFTGETVSDVLVAILDREPDWRALAPDTPRPVADLAKACLTKRLDDRLPDLARARQQLDLVRMGRTTLIPAALPPASRRRRRPLSFALGGLAALALVAALVYVALKERSGRALPATKLLAVLPAADFTGRPDGRALADGISMSLRQKLRSVPGVSITIPSSTETARESDPAKAARDQGANLLVLPSVQKSGERLRLSYSLRLDSSPVQIDAGEVDGSEADLFDLQDELAKKIAASLNVRFAGGGTPRREEIPRGSSQNDYVVALGYLERYDDSAQVRKAIEILTGISKGGESALVQAALGRAFLASYNLSKDVALAERAQAAAERAIALDAGLPEVQVTLGQILTATGRYKEAGAVIEKALQRQPDDAEAVFALAHALELSGDAAEAEKAYLRGTRLRPASWAGFNKLGVFYRDQTRYEEAIEAFRKSIALNPQVARPHNNLGAVLLALSRFEEAQSEFRRSLAIQPSPSAYSNLGTSLYLLGRYPEAAEAFGKAVALAPRSFRWSGYLGDALIRIPGREDDARRAYAAALALGEGELRVNPADSRTRALVAQCLARLGQAERARDETLRAVRAAPRDPNVLLPAAATATILGRRAEAIRWLETAVAKGLGTTEIERNPDFSDLKGDPAFQALLKRSPAGTPATK